MYELMKVRKLHSDSVARDTMIYVFLRSSGENGNLCTV
jgi:hypothetical protein